LINRNDDSEWYSRYPIGKSTVKDELIAIFLANDRCDFLPYAIADYGEPNRIGKIKEEHDITCGK